jgi:nitrilase
MSNIKIAVIQMSPGPDRAENLERAGVLLDSAAEQGARLVVLPEMFSNLSRPESWRQSAEKAGCGTEEFLQDKSCSHGIYIVGGSYIERGADGRFFNTCPVSGPDGALLGRYRKMHLFWTDIEGVTAYDERSLLSAGDERLYFDADGFRVAVGICYDLRFPEFFRPGDGAAADVFCLGAAFMEATGRAHWEVLVRARAIENLACFAAAGTVGRHFDVPGRPGEAVSTYGHSMIVSPWGEVLAECGDGDGVVTATLSRDEIESVRSRLAALGHIRDDL